VAARLEQEEERDEATCAHDFDAMW
jgi:hypothetical protein